MEPAQQHYADAPEPTWGAPPPATYGDAPKRARMGLILLTLVISELLLIGAGANQWASDRLVRHALNARLTERLFEESWLTFTWRFSPRHGLTSLWGGQLLLVLTVVVVSALLVLVLLRGAVTFGRAFFGTWLAVVFATLVGAFVRGLLDPNLRYAIPLGRLVRAVFGGPSSIAVVGGVALGLVVALVTALVAVATRRSTAPVVEAPAGPPAFADYGPPAAAVPVAGAVPPWQDQHYGPPAQPPGGGYPPAAPVGGGFAPAAAQPAWGQPAGEPAGDRTTQLPQLPEGEDAGRTTQLPRLPEGEDAGRTTQLPRLDEQSGAAAPAAIAEPGAAAGPGAADGPGAAAPVAEQPGAPAAEPTVQASAAHAEPAAEPSEPTAQAPAEPAAQGPDDPTVQAPAKHAEPPVEPTARFPRPPDDEELGHLDG